MKFSLCERIDKYDVCIIRTAILCCSNAFSETTLRSATDQLFITEWTIERVSDEKAGQVEGGLCQKIINLKRVMRRHDLISQMTKTDYSI